MGLLRRNTVQVPFERIHLTIWRSNWIRRKLGFETLEVRQAQAQSSSQGGLRVMLPAMEPQHRAILEGELYPDMDAAMPVIQVSPVRRLRWLLWLAALAPLAWVWSSISLPVPRVLRTGGLHRMDHSPAVCFAAHGGAFRHGGHRKGVVLATAHSAETRPDPRGGMGAHHPVGAARHRPSGLPHGSGAETFQLHHPYRRRRHPVLGDEPASRAKPACLILPGIPASLFDLMREQPFRGLGRIFPTPVG